MLTPREAEILLNDLCVRLGFCLPPLDHIRLRDNPPPDADAFTEAVLRAEGIDFSPHGYFYEMVKTPVMRAFQDSEAERGRQAPPEGGGRRSGSRRRARARKRGR